MIQEIHGKKQLIVWQSSGEEGIEQPVMVIAYNGSLTLEQDGNTINILPEHLEEIIKAARAIAKEVKK